MKPVNNTSQHAAIFIVTTVITPPPVKLQLHSIKFFTNLLHKFNKLFFLKTVVIEMLTKKKPAAV